MTSKHDSIALGEGREFDAIRQIIDRLGVRARGVGDDAAVLDVPRGDRLVASVDTSVEDVHFRRAWLTPREIGRRAAVAALSDLAAMGAAPLGVLVALEVPDAWLEALTDVAAGIGDAAEEVGSHVVGGNMARAPTFSITTTVLGHCFAPLRRSAVRPGDRLYVTGRLGGPDLAIDAWHAGRMPDAEARARFAAPVPRLREARWLAAAGATAAIDVSDGLVADLGHLARASGVRIEVDAERVPRHPGADAVRAMRGGEEYEIVVGAPAPLDVVAFRARFGVELTEVACAAEGPPGVEVRDAGRRVAPPSGHDHFSG